MLREVLEQHTFNILNRNNISRNVNIFIGKWLCNGCTNIKIVKTKRTFLHWCSKQEYYLNPLIKIKSISVSRAFFSFVLSGNDARIKCNSPSLPKDSSGFLQTSSDIFHGTETTSHTIFLNQ